MITQDILQELERIFPFRFARPELYRLALTHSSYANEQNGSAKAEHNERLELLGDSVLGLCITEHLFHRFPERNEGQLSKLKSYIVSAESLAAAAREHNLSQFTLLGRGESQDGGRHKDSVLANTVEALIGASYLDRGLQQARQLVLFLLNDQLQRYQDLTYSPQDAKLQLQEYVQKYYKNMPEYRTIELFVPREGRNKAGYKNAQGLQSCGFESRLFINQEFVCSGRGNSKKQAEKQAAKQALKEIFAADDLPI